MAKMFRLSDYEFLKGLQNKPLSDLQVAYKVFFYGCYINVYVSPQIVDSLLDRQRFAKDFAQLIKDISELLFHSIRHIEGRLEDLKKDITKELEKF